jgi:hypothetical protein
MSLRTRPVLLGLVLAASVSAQVVYIDDANPATGVSNAFPFAQLNGFTTLHVYTAAQLAAGGVCAGATLTDIAIAPSSGTSGTYNAPQARLSVGHLANDPPIAGGWESNIANPTVIHDLTGAPYTFPWALNTWVSLPEVATAGFVWNGVASIAIFYTSSSGVTGGFNAHRTATNLRHAVAIFNATNQAPTSNGLFAMKVRLMWAPPAPTWQVNQPEASLDIDGISAGPCAPAVITRGIGVTSILTIASSLVGNGWEVVYTVPEPGVPAGGGAIQLPGAGQLVNVDFAAPSLSFLNGLTLPPFPGFIVLPLTFPAPVALTAQLAVVNPGNPDGFSLSSAVRLVVQ